ncbi:MAG: hypothetical protein GEU76_03155 [Alphaproteobacteria bacterium]|nr:hypothetical protein [Alphaproteobacteria bacterium]
MDIGEIRRDGTRERRRHPRRRVAIRAFLEVPPRAAQPCKVYNVSVGNALVGTAQPLHLDQPVVLHVESFGSIAGHVARVTSTTVAIAFTGVNARALADFIIVNDDSDAEPGNMSPAA